MRVKKVRERDRLKEEEEEKEEEDEEEERGGKLDDESISQSKCFND